MEHMTFSRLCHAHSRCSQFERNKSQILVICWVCKLQRKKQICDFFLTSKWWKRFQLQGSFDLWPPTRISATTPAWGPPLTPAIGSRSPRHPSVPPFPRGPPDNSVIARAKAFQLVFFNRLFTLLRRTDIWAKPCDWSTANVQRT